MFRRAPLPTFALVTSRALCRETTDSRRLTRLSASSNTPALSALRLFSDLVAPRALFGFYLPQHLPAGIILAYLLRACRTPGYAGRSIHPRRDQPSVFFLSPRMSANSFSTESLVFSSRQSVPQGGLQGFINEWRTRTPTGAAALGQTPMQWSNTQRYLDDRGANASKSRRSPSRFSPARPAMLGPPGNRDALWSSCACER